MKKWKKILALSLGSMMAFSLFAGCGGGNEEEGGNPPPTPPEGGDPPITETPDAQAPAYTDAQVTLAVNGNGTRQISDELFGVFLEDINYASYLLDANLLNNGNFESLVAAADGWTGVGGAQIGVEHTDGIFASHAVYHKTSEGVNVNPNYGAVTVTAANGGARNTGYSQVPMAVKEGTKYTFSAFVRSPDKAVNMTVRMADGSNTYFEETIPVAQNATWVKYVREVTSGGTATAGLHLDLTFDAPGKYYIDAVSLETQDSTGGIKQYVYDAIAELAPKFIRFPGGCIIEGDADPASGGADTNEIYDWKNSIGAAITDADVAGADDVPAFTYSLNEDGTVKEHTSYGEWATRTNNMDLWELPKGKDYNMDYGVGFYEYFLLCDNLGASAVPILNCGLSDQGGAALEGYRGTALNGRHKQKVQDFIQDAIDLIEFAKGDETTKWGAIRANMGHPEPFEMNYIGIGNEQFGAYFTGYYEEFLKSAAFKEALATYNIKPIVGNGMFMNNCEGYSGSKDGTALNAAKAAQDSHIIENISDYGVHDQHYYVGYPLLFENYNMYDGYKRPNTDSNKKQYYEVFVGEYSANADQNETWGKQGYPLVPNSLITALSEAAMMTSYERNGDIVKLAAYAPMFASATGSRHWAVDMMYYTNSEIVRTTNYYVQKMFMHNMGDIVLTASKLNYASGFEKTFALPTEGSIREVEVNKFYYVVSKDEETGDIIAKLVNATGTATKFNVTVSNATPTGYATVTELSDSDYKATNSLGSVTVTPQTHSIGWTGNSFGYEIKPYSLTIIRIKTSA